MGFLACGWEGSVLILDWGLSQIAYGTYSYVCDSPRDPYNYIIVSKNENLLCDNDVPPPISDGPAACLRPSGLQVGKPVLPATGEETHSETDYTGSGANPLSLTRSYRSSRVVGVATGGAKAGHGQSWTHNYSTYLAIGMGLGSGGHKAKVMLGDGTVRVFTLSRYGYEPEDKIGRAHV